MSPKTPEQFKNIREEKKTQIMQTALEVFAEKSFQGASISQIAKRAGISKGLIYNYFESKEDLLKQIIYQALDSIMVLFEHKSTDSFGDDDFKELINMNFEMIKTDYRLWKLYISLIMQPDAMKLIEKKLPEFLEVYLGLLVRYFEKKGVADPISEARLLGAILDGISLNYIIDPETFPLEKAKQLIFDKFI